MEPHVQSRVDGLHAQAYGEMGLAPAGLAVEHEVLGAGHEVEGEQPVERVSVGQLHVREVVAVQAFGDGELRAAQEAFVLRPLPVGQLGPQEAQDGVRLARGRPAGEVVHRGLGEEQCVCSNGSFWYLFGGFIVLGRFFVHIWAGDTNADAYWLAVIMVFPVMIPLTQNTGIEIQRAKNRHKMRSLIYILTSVIDIVISVLLIPKIGYWATAIGYDASILLGTGMFMNWYYHTRIGLNMLYFWRNMLPTIALALGVVALCLGGSVLLPVNSILLFVLWGIVYSLLFGGLAWKFSLTDAERGKVLNRFADRRGNS